jgi:SAM-dependent methyltransferase
MLPELIHAHHNRHLEDLPFWLELADQTGDPVLELGCGTGRLLIPLAQAGHHAIGVDNDPEMLMFLKANIGSQILSVPMFFIADISEFNLAEHFPLIILPCNTFSILPDNKRLACLGCVRKHLKPEGVFAVSIPNPELLRVLPARAEAEVEDEFTHPKTGNPVQVSSSWRRTKHTFTVTWTYDQLLPDGMVERFAAEAVHQMIPADTYLDEIRNAGLTVTGTYGDFDHSAYHEDSPYLICLARTINISR